ncbi:hypothetical protein [Roseibium sp.]|uniref:hypothetical protein n=1 Tax=Roseibium sp. TaxID=1936156 RepID=UPI003296C8C2
MPVYRCYLELLHMRLKPILFVCIIMALPAQAETVRVPKLPDGSVDVEQVMSGFEIAFLILSFCAQDSDFSGKLLGEDFGRSVVATDTTGDLSIAIDAPTLSEHANFLIAVLATGAICARNGLLPGPVLWSETKKRTGSSWEVSTSCSPSNG